MAKKTSRSPEKSSEAALRKRSSAEASKLFHIRNELGLHARAAAQFVKIATRFAADVAVLKDTREVNGKSIMGILMLAAPKGSKITVKAVGSDAQEALDALGELIENKFGEN